MTQHCCQSPPITSEISIAAPVELVRHIFTEFSAWSEWNPLYEYMTVVRSNSIALEQQPNDVGTVLQTAVRFYPVPVRCTITESTPNVISWTSHISCIAPVRNKVTNTFTVVNDGTTMYNREEHVVGLLSGLEYCLMKKKLQRLADNMCEAFKKRCEAFTNLSDTIRAPIRNCQVPSNEMDLRAFLEGSSALSSDGNEVKIYRPCGGRHSWAPSVASLEQGEESHIVLIDTSQMKTPREVVTLGSQSNILRIGPGLTQGEVASLAAKHDLCLPATGAMQTSIRVGGFLVSGCHGTGNYPPVSNFVVALRVVVINKTLFPDAAQNVGAVILTEETNFPDKYLTDAKLVNSVHELYKLTNTELLDDNTTKDLNLMDIVRVNFGTLGIVTEFYVLAEPNFFVNAVDEVVSLEKVIPRPEAIHDNGFVHDYFNANDYLELFYSPFNTLNHVTSEPEPGNIWLKRASKSSQSMRCFFKKWSWDPLGFFSNPFNNWLNSQVVTSSDDLNAVALNASSSITGSSCNRFFTCEGVAAYGYGINDCCAGLCGTIRLALCCGKTAHKYTVPINEFTLYQRSSPEGIIDCEMEIPINFELDPTALRFRRAWWYVIDLIKENAKEGKYPLNLMFHCRFNRPCKALLSSCYNTNADIWFATIEFLSYTGELSYSKEPCNNQEYREYLQAFKSQVMGFWLRVNDDLINDNANNSYLKPRPHFAKDWIGVDSVSNQVGEIFGSNIKSFENIRLLLDPNGHFNGGIVPLLVSLVHPEKEGCHPDE